MVGWGVGVGGDGGVGLGGGVVGGGRGGVSGARRVFCLVTSGRGGRGAGIAILFEDNILRENVFEHF